MAKAKPAPRQVADTAPKFPYTNKPGSLRRLLKEIPKKPKPPKFDKGLLRAWGFSDTNDLTMLRVLKGVNLLNDKNEPTDKYAQFMSLDTGGKVLGPEIEKLYAPLFQASFKPYEEGTEKLQNLFNIHSGGGDRALELQMQTFKALCENAIFGGDPIAPNGAPLTPSDANMTSVAAIAGSPTGAVVNINLHIHLPENKTRRDYEDIIEDIGRYIFGRTVSDRHD